ncbi:MAG: hypothetical protein LBC64_10365 [Fibromonadaceae bacterium]|jgi:glycosyltransferase involved in cell wall biosynthesis|nr:hypothetical protein [Fibromonadaceae bacterium]
MFGIKTKIVAAVRRQFYRFYTIRQDFINVNPIFDTRYLDEEICDHALSLVSSPLCITPKNKNNIAFLASELSGMGGHTELLKNLAQALPKGYKSKLFLTRKARSEKYAALKIAEIGKYSEIDGVDFCWKNEKKMLNKLLKQVLEFSPNVLITFIHMEDSFAVGLIALLKKHTEIKIIFCNIGSQYSSLGMSFAHLIWEGMPATAFVTQKYRKLKNTKVLGLCYLTKENLPKFSAQEIMTVKRELGIPENALCTMTGCSSYKLFENGKSSYLEMIKKLLEKNENLWHVLITVLDEEQKKILKETDMPNRFIVADFKPNFKLYFKCADVFIDSIPFSSALTMVDLMSLKVPFVAFKNKDNLAFTFYEYLPKNYAYLFENIFDMQAGIEKLLSDKEERERIADSNYGHFLENFEGNKVAKKILDADSVDSEIDEEQYKDFKAVKLVPWGK